MSTISTNTGFKNPNEFSIHIEHIKKTQEFDSYIESIVWFAENESDLEIEQIAKFLNKKLREAIEHEANIKNLLKDSSKSVQLFEE